jgi:hypothetical protein
MWKPLFEMGLEIVFAWRTFRWDNEAQAKAHVHCVIVGFHVRDYVNAEAQRRGDSQSCFDKINKIDRIGDDENPDNPVNPVKKDLHVTHIRLKRIFDGDKVIEAANINPYLMDAPTIFIESRTKPICDVPPFIRGCQPTDDGNLILTAEEKEKLLQSEPLAASFVRPFMMGADFIQRKPRYCLWMKNVSPHVIRSCPTVMERITKVREFRLASKKPATRAKAETPTLFDDIREPSTDYIALPKVSSENRRYIPIDYLKREVIPGDMLFVLSGSSLYHFGILTSSVHMAWMRTVCGRLKSDYRYSANIVYNNFPWPEVGESGFSRVEGESVENVLDRINKIDRIGDDENPDNPVNPVKKTLHVSTRLKNTSAPLRLCVKKTSTNLCDSLRSLRQKIESTAQAILDARAKYPDATLAQMYGDKMYLFPELVAAHAANDAAVMKAYGYAPTMTEPEIVADLMRRYQELAISR